MCGDVPKLPGAYETPTVFYTFAGQVRSAAVLWALTHEKDRPFVRIFGENERVEDIDFQNAVAFFDALIDRQFRPIQMAATRMRVPSWASYARWGVVVGEQCTIGGRIAHCGRYSVAIFHRRFQEEIGKGNLPWGPRRTRVRRHRLPPVRALNETCATAVCTA